MSELYKGLLGNIKLSRIVLEKDGCLAILQGMIHVGPQPLYARLQKDIDWAIENNFQIFYEGVKMCRLRKRATRNEKKIGAFFRKLLKTYPIFANILGMTLQKEKITYPKDAINADVDFSEMVTCLAKNGFRCGESRLISLPGTRVKIRIIKKSNRKNLKKDLEKLEDIYKKGGFKRFFFNCLMWLIGKLIFFGPFRKAKPVIIGYRNKIAVSIIREKSNSRNIFVHYGNSHIKGLTKLLKQDGWKIKERQKVKLADFLGTS